MFSFSKTSFDLMSSILVKTQGLPKICTFVSSVLLPAAEFSGEHESGRQDAQT